MPYRQVPAIRAKAAAEIRKMLDAGVFEPATSEWAAPTVLVPKKDGSLRFYVDYRRLNAKNVADAYQLPRIEDCLDPLANSQTFTTLDCNAGYWQAPVAPEDRDKTTFPSYFGTYRYVRRSFGLRKAPATFQRALDIILSGVRWQPCLIYLEDFIVFSKDAETHLRHVEEILLLLRRTGITLKLQKCSFFPPKVDYLAHVITPGKLSVAVDNSKAFAKAVFTRTVTQLRSFLGAANVYRRFMEKYSNIARTLNSMLRKYAEPGWENPTKEQTKAFETLETRLISPPILALPKAGRPCMIETDASAYQLSTTLLQRQDEDKPNGWVPIGYWSKTLTDTERNYSTTERECYSVVLSVTTLRSYIEGLMLTVRTDHAALRWLMKISNSTGCLMRWRLRLCEFDFTVKYRPGLVHQVPEALSRILTPEGNEEKPINDEVPTYGNHEAVFASTRRKASSVTPTKRATTARKRITRKRTARTLTDAGRMITKGRTDLTDEEQLLPDFQQKHIDHNTTNDDEAIDGVLDEGFAIFDMALAYLDDGRDPSIADVPVRLTKDKLLEAQPTDDLFQTYSPDNHGTSTRTSSKTTSASCDDNT